MKRALQQSIISMYRYFALLSGVYFFGISSYSIINLPEQEIMLLQSNINIAASIALAFYFSFPSLFKGLGQRYLVYGITFHMLASAFSFGLNFFDPGLNLLSAMNSIWSFLPVWLVLLVIIAWQYRHGYVLIYTFAIFLLEISLLIYVVKEINLANIQYLGLPLILAFAFVIAGRMISQLVKQERDQQEALIRANEKLSAYYQTLEDLSISRERNRIARELHDTLSHTLSGTAINLEAVKFVLPNDIKKAIEMLDSSLAVVREGLVETRRVLIDLRAAPVEEFGLLPAINQLLEGLETKEGFRVKKEMPDKLSVLPPKVEHVFYRIVQEGLQNIVRHASAKQVSFRLAQTPEALRMRLHDDGLGFAKDQLEGSGHLGLLGMQERAESIAAELEVQSKPNEGTTLSLEWRRSDD